MALDTFANLKVAIATELWRATDANVIAAIPDFITLAEAEMNRRINTRRKYKRSDASISSEFVDLPSDFDAAVGFTLTSTDPDTPLRYVDPAEALRLKNSLYSAAGVPVCYTIIGDCMQIIPSPDTSYTGELTYRQKIPALTDLNTTNWVLTSHPDVYLYGSLIHSAPFLKNDERITIWGGLHERAIASLIAQDAISNFGSPLNASSKRVFG